MRRAREIELSEAELATLTKWSRGRSTQARVVVRAKIVLLAARGELNKDIAMELGIRRRRCACGENDGTGLTNGSCKSA